MYSAVGDANLGCGVGDSAKVFCFRGCAGGFRGFSPNTKFHHNWLKNRKVVALSPPLFSWRLAFVRKWPLGEKRQTNGILKVDRSAKLSIELSIELSFFLSACLSFY